MCYLQPVSRYFLIHSRFKLFWHVRHLRPVRCLSPLVIVVLMVLSGENSCPLIQWVLWLFIVRARPLAAISALLSLLVPRNRCVGSTHNRTSHVWHTHSPGGISPYASMYACRCTSIFLRLILRHP
jgi:hypothetical protein